MHKAGSGDSNEASGYRGGGVFPKQGERRTGGTFLPNSTARGKPRNSFEDRSMLFEGATDEGEKERGNTTAGRKVSALVLVRSNAAGDFTGTSTKEQLPASRRAKKCGYLGDWRTGKKS